MPMSDRALLMFKPALAPLAALATGELAFEVLDAAPVSRDGDGGGGDNPD
jgi:hypothetical protein